MEMNPDWACSLNQEDLYDLINSVLRECPDSWYNRTNNNSDHIFSKNGRSYRKECYITENGETRTQLSIVGIGSFNFKISDALEVLEYFSYLIENKTKMIETKVLPSGVVVENRKDKDLNLKNFWCLKEHEKVIHHYEGGPAVEYHNGTLHYFTFGKKHRLDGPATIYSDGQKQYFIAGNNISETEYYWHPDVMAYRSKMQNNTPSLVVNEVVKKTENKTEQKNIKEDTMSNNSFLDMVKQDTIDGAYRSSANQINKVAKAAILSQLEKNTTSEGVATIANLLDTEMGGAFISMLIGLGITYAPKISDDPRAVRLAKEFRVSGISTGMNQVINVAMTTLMPAFNDAISKLPVVDVSIKSPNSNKRVLAQENLEEEFDEDVLNVSKAKNE